MQSGEGVRLLVVDDDAPTRRLLQAYTKDTIFSLREASTVQEALQEITKHCPDLILLDVGLPDGDGIEVIHSVREWSTIPIIVISGRTQEALMVAYLEAGADDYVTKPFGVAELIARMKVALRHVHPTGTSDPAFEADGLKVDFELRRVTASGVEVHLSPLEYRLLSVLVKYAGKIVSTRRLLEEVWGPGYADESQYLRLYIGYLRKKLEADPANPSLIVTEHGIGYRLAV